MGQHMYQQIRKIIGIGVLVSFIAFSGNGVRVFAHGGEDHGDSKIKAAPTEKGYVAYSAHIGGLEVMIKYPVLEPDTATGARLFITKYETNEAADKVSPTVEMESATGTITQITAEKTDGLGSFNLNIPALPEGSYTLRAKISYAGETDTASFSGIRVEHTAAETAAGMSWLRTSLILLTGSLVLALFAGLIFFVWRFSGSGDIRNETVSA